MIRLQYEIDYAEAGPKAPVSRFQYRSVRIESRFSVLAELETMKRFIDAMPELMARRLASIWCDSRCGSNYMIDVRDGQRVPNLERAVRDAIMKASSGHNGIAIDEGCIRRADIEPDWNEE